MKISKKMYLACIQMATVIKSIGSLTKSDSTEYAYGVQMLDIKQDTSGN